MSDFFADTFFFIALLFENDAAHARAEAMAGALAGHMYTTTFVLTEVADAMAVPGRRERFRPFLEFLRTNPLVTIVAADQALFDRGAALYDKRPDKEWSLTDCISFVVMEENGLFEALTGDHHFEQAGFVALMK
jgi:uncharacterized protein